MELRTYLLGLGLTGLGAWLWEAPPLTASGEGAAAASPTVVAAVPAEPDPLPELLSETGLYRSAPAASAAGPELHPEVLQFSPQYPLWSDGATKRRYLRLPPGSVIDGSHPDAWVFPIGTRFWKELALGRRVETRYLERTSDGSWRFAAYAWDEDERDARLVPEEGVRSAAPIGQTGLSHDIPSRGDCLACHEGVGLRSPVLGFSALQLSGDRDPRAPHAEAALEEALDLEQLLARALVTGYPEALGRPRIQAETPEARAALGYLHGNCSGCHNRSGPLADIALDLEQTVGEPDATARVLASIVGAESRFRLPGEGHSLRLTPGDPDRSALRFRLASRQAAAQMPPLGTKVTDGEATRLVTQWITHMKAPAGARKETP